MIKASEEQLRIGIVSEIFIQDHFQNTILYASRFGQSLGNSIDAFVNREKKNFFMMELGIGIGT